MWLAISCFYFCSLFLHRFSIRCLRHQKFPFAVTRCLRRFSRHVFRYTNTHSSHYYYYFSSSCHHTHTHAQNNVCVRVCVMIFMIPLAELEKQKRRKMWTTISRRQTCIRTEPSNSNSSQPGALNQTFCDEGSTHITFYFNSVHKMAQTHSPLWYSIRTANGRKKKIGEKIQANPQIENVDLPCARCIIRKLFETQNAHQSYSRVWGVKKKPPVTVVPYSGCYHQAAPLPLGAILSHSTNRHRSQSPKPHSAHY